MNNENCLANILKAIVVLQNNAGNIDCNDNSCTRPFLGELQNNVCFNTRLVTFYRCDNSLVTLPYTIDGVTNETTVFRVENVTNDSVTVLLIGDENGTSAHSPNIEAPSSIFTIVSKSF